MRALIAAAIATASACSHDTDALRALRERWLADGGSDAGARDETTYDASMTERDDATGTTDAATDSVQIDASAADAATDDAATCDEGTTTCGVGLCARTVENCVGGVPQTCVPGAPSFEVCDGSDNDCDGAVDCGDPEACCVWHCADRASWPCAVWRCMTDPPTPCP